jgi:two-component system chemotaxis sensor kinase CheA
VREAAKKFIETDDFAIPEADQIAASIQGMMRQPIGEMLVAAGLVDSTTINRALEVQQTSPDKQPPRLGEVLVAMGAVTPEQVQLLLQEQQYNRARNEQVASSSSTPSSADNAHGVSAITVDSDNFNIQRLSRMGFLLDQLLAMQFSEAARPLLAELRDHLGICHRVAVHGLTERLQKLALDVAVKGNKRLHCHMEGVELFYEMEETGLLVESLLHLVANAAEHGIESMEERLRAGKEKVGQLWVRLTQIDAEFFVSVEDDGRGFDFAHAAAAIATTENMARGNDMAPTNWSQFERLLVQAAADKAQCREDSGGRQGLVAVRAFLHEQGGSMEVTSSLGKGTRVTVRLPRKHCKA